MGLTGKRVLLGLTGGIAAYKAAELARRLVKGGADVRVAMTDAATRFITPMTMQALTGQREMDATAILDYFAPLSKWLDEQLAGKPVGW
jgi:phosphopantothenoylcysteine synthetase/decarboxylase